MPAYDGFYCNFHVIIFISDQIFLGNIDNGTVTVVDLDPVIESQIIRIYPQTWYGSNISMRLELYGCTQARQLCCKIFNKIT